MSDFCYGDEMNTLCNNEFEYKNSMIIRPPNKKESKLAHKYIFIDTADYNVIDGKFTVEFDETIKDIVEIELMSCHLPINDSDGTLKSFQYNINAATDTEYSPLTVDDVAINTNKLNYDSNKYLLLFLDNLDLGNYKKISKNQNIKNCFARLPIQGKSVHTFFGRIKNFTNVYQFKPILQKLNKLTIKITDRNGANLLAFSDSPQQYNDAISQVDEETRNIDLITSAERKFSIQLTFGITYQTTPDLFD
tara:strand:+ start:31 stop:777 length:747 start_codon:yes stop_codon:yes gene_type:complete